MIMGSSRKFKHVYKVNGKNTSASNRELIKYRYMYVDSRKPTRDQHMWVICMSKAGSNINDVARHFGFHKTTAYRTINRFWQTGLAGERQKSGQTDKT